MAAVAVTVALYTVDKVLNFLDQELVRNKNIVNDVEEIKRHLSSMQACLLDAKGGVYSEVLKNLVEQIRDVSHEMEDVLDEFMIHVPRSSSKSQFLKFTHNLKHWIPVRDLQFQIYCIRSKILSITNSQPFGQLIRTTSSGGSSNTHQTRLLEEIVEEDEAIGIDLLKQNLGNLLSDGDSRCKTISVVGPGGSGKTVLVNSVYKSKREIGQFDFHAWLSLPRSSTFDQLLQNLLSQFCMQFPNGNDPGKNLKFFLKGKRYFIVLDYVWRYQDYTYIKTILPDESNGSRIIITTRYDDVAAKCSASDNLIFRINGLEWKQSWRLFCKKAFGNDSGDCPSYLQDLSENIVKRCEGLPQAISAVGSLLSRKPKLPAEWIRVHDNFGREIQANCISTMLLPSYYDLPSNRKCCLLYFSILPEDYSIKRERLIRLWVSEGFVKKSGSESLEKIAEDYLNELISRNLVTTSSRDFSGKVKSCRVLNLVREFILLRSREEKFAEVVTDSEMDLMDKMRIRRLSIETANSSSLGLRRIRGLKLSTVRSLFVFGLNKDSSIMIDETLQRVRLLKVLDLENVPLERFPDCILEVALLLRYLSLRNTGIEIVPKNIKKLRFLEYLDLKQTQVTCLPEEIFSLHYLQHLLVFRCNPMKYDTFDRLQGVDICGEFRVLPLMQKLSIIKVNQSPNFFETLGQLTLMKKLGLVDLKLQDGVHLCSCIEKMQNLSTLDLRSLSKEEYLDLHHINIHPAFLRHLYLKGKLTTLPKWIPSLNGLVRLLLRWSKLSTSPIESLQYMPNLMELEMIDAFSGDILFFDNGGFPKLRTLYIEQFDGLDTIVVLDEAMPSLQKLTIVRCMSLWELPSGIEKLRSLEELLLYDMPQEFTSRLARNSRDRSKIDHVPVIRSFTVGDNGSWVIQNFSYYV